MRVVDSNLQKATWTRVTGPDINPVPARDYSAFLVPAGNWKGWLRVTNVSDRANGADLVTVKRPVPTPPYPNVALNFLRLRMKMFISAVDAANLGRLETDVKACLIKAPTSDKPGIPQTANGSTQVNFSNGFWQIDGDPPHWLNTTFAPVVPVDEPFDYYHDLSFDPTAKTFSVLGCGFGDRIYQTPANMQNVPWQTANWQAIVAAIQLQIMCLQPGVCSVLYNDIALVWADSAAELAE